MTDNPEKPAKPARKAPAKAATKAAPAKAATKAPANRASTTRARKPKADDRTPEREDIAERAYYIHLEEGGGDHVKHWLRAERELKKR